MVSSRASDHSPDFADTRKRPQTPVARHNRTTRPRTAVWRMDRERVTRSLRHPGERARTCDYTASRPSPACERLFAGGRAGWKKRGHPRGAGGRGKAVGEESRQGSGGERTTRSVGGDRRVGGGSRSPKGVVRGSQPDSGENSDLASSRSPGEATARRNRGKAATVPGPDCYGRMRVANWCQIRK